MHHLERLGRQRRGSKGPRERNSSRQGGMDHPDADPRREASLRKTYRRSLEQSKFFPLVCSSFPLVDGHSGQIYRSGSNFVEISLRPVTVLPYSYTVNDVRVLSDFISLLSVEDVNLSSIKNRLSFWKEQN
ncbi:hypothetical protein RvY_11954 [Ramazzottius varieornatus]|uniref:Uncharacterized protein n=1 Tax=Ramazzottius varieornatus TaxID=947166 RepID=A0A1D1VHX3_RAMVA|nr:hypothetical protein RvY_11954 [Ramazzottius varieornatus]